MQNKLKKRILIVAESIDVEDSSGSKANVALIYNLKKIGYDIQVYHYTRKKIQLPGIECVAIKENRRSILFFLSRTERFLRHKLNLDLHRPLEKVFGFSFTLFNDRNSIVAGLKKIEKINSDLIITLSKGGSFRPHHALLKLPELQHKWLAYIHDPYPRNSFPRPYDYVEPGHSQKREFFLKVASNAKYLAYPSKLLAKWMESYYKSARNKGVVIPHQTFEDQELNVELPDFFKKNYFTLLHAGTLLGPRKPFPLINAFRKFLKSNPEAKGRCQLLLLGPESKFSLELFEISKEVPDLYVSQSSIKFSTVLELQRQVNVNIILEAIGPFSPFLPGKFPHCVQADKPILLLGPYYSESRRLLGEDYPYWAEADNVEKISILIGDLFRTWKNKRSQKLERPDLVNYCSSGNLKDVLNSIFKRL
jgi:hypothetical protein